MPEPRVINDNGAWCWFQDERALIDADRQLLVVGSVPAPEGPGGDARAGNIELTVADLATGTATGRRPARASRDRRSRRPGALAPPRRTLARRLREAQDGQPHPLARQRAGRPHTLGPGADVRLDRADRRQGRHLLEPARTRRAPVLLRARDQRRPLCARLRRRGRHLHLRGQALHPPQGRLRQRVHPLRLHRRPHRLHHHGPPSARLRQLDLPRLPRLRGAARQLRQRHRRPRTE